MNASASTQTRYATTGISVPAIEKLKFLLAAAVCFGLGISQCLFHFDAVATYLPFLLIGALFVYGLWKMMGTLSITPEGVIRTRLGFSQRLSFNEITQTTLRGKSMVLRGNGKRISIPDSRGPNSMLKIAAPILCERVTGASAILAPAAPFAVPRYALLAIGPAIFAAWLIITAIGIAYARGISWSTFPIFAGFLLLPLFVSYRIVFETDRVVFIKPIGATTFHRSDFVYAIYGAGRIWLRRKTGRDILLSPIGIPDFVLLHFLEKVYGLEVLRLQR